LQPILPRDWDAAARDVKVTAPAMLEEMMKLARVNRSWRVKILAVKVVLRGVAAKLTGKQWVAGGGALQGRMRQAALRAAVEFRTGSPVSELILDNGAVRGVLTTKDDRPWRIGAVDHGHRVTEHLAHPQSAKFVPQCSLL
jgi:3-oxosteroid 1-dehydrogenase